MIKFHKMQILLLFIAISSTNSNATATGQLHHSGGGPFSKHQSSLGAPLMLADEGTFFLNNEVVDPPGISVNGIYVHYRIPLKQRLKSPVIMVHGSNHTGNTFETTPDGREGWATYFVRKGFPIYVIDVAGRGRSGFDATAINQARTESDPSLLPRLGVCDLSCVWSFFRFGPETGVFWDDTQFPTKRLDQYLAQLVANSESTLEGGSANTTAGLLQLLDKIGPSVVLVHSLGAVYGRGLLQERPELVKALIDVEGRAACESPVPTQEEIMSAFVPVPFLFVAGDHGYAAEASCRSHVEAINEAGGKALYMHLPEEGLIGNTHMMMMDKNNLQVADLLIEWIHENVDLYHHKHKRHHGHGHHNKHGKHNK